MKTLIKKTPFYTTYSDDNLIIVEDVKIKEGCENPIKQLSNLFASFDPYYKGNNKPLNEILLNLKK